MWDVVRSGAEFKILEHQLASCGLSGAKLPSLVHVHSAQLVKCLDRWLSSILVYWQKEDRWGNFFMFPRRKLDVDKAAAAAKHLELFLFDPLPGWDSFQALFMVNGYGNFSSAVKRVETVRASKIYVHSNLRRRTAADDNDAESFHEQGPPPFRRRDTDMSHQMSKQALLEASWKEYSNTERRMFATCSDSDDTGSDSSIGRVKKPAKLTNWLEVAVTRSSVKRSKRNTAHDVPAGLGSDVDGDAHGDDGLGTDDEKKVNQNVLSKAASRPEELPVPPVQLGSDLAPNKSACTSSNASKAHVMARSASMGSRNSGVGRNNARRASLGVSQFGVRTMRLVTAISLDQTDEAESPRGGDLGNRYRERNLSEVFFARGFAGVVSGTPNEHLQSAPSLQQQLEPGAGPGHVRSESGHSMFSTGSDLFHLRFSSKKHSTDDYESIFSTNETDIDYDYDYDYDYEDDSCVDRDSYFGQDDSILLEDEYEYQEHPQQVDEEAEYQEDASQAISSRLVSFPSQVLKGSGCSRSFKQRPPAHRLSMVGQAVEYTSSAVIVDQPDSFALFATTVDLSGRWCPLYAEDSCTDCYTPVSIPDTEMQRKDFLKEAHLYTLAVLTTAAEKLAEYVSTVETTTAIA